jgi:hypothetical protein
VEISQGQLQELARAIVEDLDRAQMIEVGSRRDAAIAAVHEQLESYWKAEAALGREAERLAEQHLATAGRQGVGLDRKRVVQMIKTKLAQERGFPL